MISFRFHLVSLAAIFLALALGIVLSTAFLNDATVNQLESSIKRLRAEADSAQSELEDWRDFGRETEDALVAGRLAEMRVLTIVPESLDNSVADRVRSLLATAGAIDAGTLTVDDAWASETPPIDDIAAALGIVGPRSIESAIDLAAERLALEFGAGGGATLPALIEANLMRLDAGDPSATPGSAARFLVVGDGPPSGLLEPLTRALAAASPSGVLVGDSGADDEIAESLVGVLRDDPDGAQFSTVDNLDSPTGRVAAVLALRDFDRGGVGNYGSGHGADRAAPAGG